MKINFKLLGTFLAVADNASFRKAAEQSHLSLPAVSMQVKQLEDRDGLVLFEIRSPFEIGERLAVARQAQIEIRRDGHHIFDRPAPTFLCDGRAAVSETDKQKERT